MDKIDKVLIRLNSIEDTIEQIYKEIIGIRQSMDERELEQFQVMTRLENIADFIKDRYDIVVEEKEKFNAEKMENENIMWYIIFEKNFRRIGFWKLRRKILES